MAESLPGAGASAPIAVDDRALAWRAASSAFLASSKVVGMPWEDFCALTKCSLAKKKNEEKDDDDE